jgi:hypothetical protein
MPWLMLGDFLSSFGFTIRHRPGVTIWMEDAISRSTDLEKNVEEEEDKLTLEETYEKLSKIKGDTTSTHGSLKNPVHPLFACPVQVNISILIANQKTDTFIQDIRNWSEGKEFMKEKNMKIIERFRTCWIVTDEAVYFLDPEPKEHTVIILCNCA